MKKFHHFQLAVTSLFLLWRGGNDIAIAFTIVRQRRRCGHDRPMRNNNGRRCTHVVVEGWYDKNQHSLSLSLSLSLSSDVVDTIINSDSDSNNKKRDALRKQTLDAALLAMHSISCHQNENTANIDNSLSQKKHTSDASSPLFNQRWTFKSNNNMVEVRRSTIPNAGLGLFASKNIKVGDILSFYPVNTIGIVDAIDGSIVVRQRRRDDVVGDDIDTTDDAMPGCKFARGESKDEQDQQYVTSNDDVDDDETYLLHVLGSGSRTLMHVNIALDLGGSSIFVNNVALKQHHREQHNDDSDSSSEKSNYSSTSTTKSTATPGSSTSTTNNGFDGHRVNDGATILTNDEAGTLAYYHSSRLLKNCIHVPFGPCPVLALIATRNVLCGEELLTTYGCSCESFCMQLYVLIFVELYLAC